jgi:putative peptidoglycan lipid II flippase
VLLRRQGFFVPRAGWVGFVLRIFVALAVLAALLVWLGGSAQEWLSVGLWTRVGRLALLVVAGGAVYFGTLYVLGFRIRDFNRREQVKDPLPAEPDIEE